MKVMRHAKTSESMAHMLGKNKLIQTVLEEVGLLDKDFKSPIINMFKELKEAIYKELKEHLRMVSY